MKKYLVLLVMLTGCAHNQMKKTNEMLAQECGYEDPALDPIRSKMAFIFSGDPAEMTKEMLNNHNFITPSEKPVLALFLKKRNYCNRHEHNMLLLRNKKVMEDFMYLLYNGKITWGDLAQYRIDVAHLALDVQWEEKQMMNSKLLMGCDKK